MAQRGEGGPARGGHGARPAPRPSTSAPPPRTVSGPQAEHKTPSSESESPRSRSEYLGQDHVRGGQPELCGNLRRQGGSRSLPASQTARGPCRTRFECVAPAHPRVALCGAPRQAAGRFLHVKHGAVKVRLGEVVETPVLVHARHLEVHVRTQLRRRLPTRAVSTAWPGLLQVDARGPVSALGSAPRRCVLGMGSAFWPGPKGSMSELPPPSHARVARLRATVRTG
jgi:hypothetical protein